MLETEASRGGPPHMHIHQQLRTRSLRFGSWVYVVAPRCQRQGPARFVQNCQEQAFPCNARGHLLGYAKLQPAWANQPLGLRWPAIPGLFLHRAALVAHDDVLRIERPCSRRRRLQRRHWYSYWRSANAHGHQRQPRHAPRTPRQKRRGCSARARPAPPRRGVRARWARPGDRRVSTATDPKRRAAPT